MNVDIANMVVNVGEELQKINWYEAVITLISVFLGALFAYKFGLKLELRKAKRQMRGDFCALSAEVQLNLIEMLRYRKNYLNAIYNAYEKNDLSLVQGAPILPNVSFHFDLNKYIFLADYNRAFLSEIKMIETIEYLLKSAWDSYLNNLSLYLPKINTDKKVVIEILKTSFIHFYKSYGLMCVKLYYLNKHLCDCYGRYFNVYYIENVRDEYKAVDDIDDSIKQEILEPSIVQWDKDFNNYWREPANIVCYLCLQWRIFKHTIDGIKNFFIKTHKCNDCEACKIKNERK